MDEQKQVNDHTSTHLVMLKISNTFSQREKLWTLFIKRLFYELIISSNYFYWKSEIPDRPLQ